MIKQTSNVLMFTACALAAACGGSSVEATTAADVSAEGPIQNSAEPGTEALTPVPFTPDPNSTQVTFDPTLTQQCGLKEAKVYFPYDSTEVKANADNRVRAMADCLISGNLKGKEIVLVGHTDPRGSDEYNKELGKSRADAIAELLMEAGMPKEKLVIRSAGESGASSDADEWPSDRRVQIALVAD